MNFKNILKKEILIYAVGSLLCILTLFLVYRLWNSDFSIPFAYMGDCLLNSSIVKGMIDNGWINFNQYIGAPDGQTLYDFPLGADNANLLLIKIITLFTNDWALSLNIFYLLGFLLITNTSIFAFRKLKISASIAIVGSILYSFLPYHLMRNVAHLFLSNYYMVPLMTILIIWIMKEGISLYNTNGSLKNIREIILDKKILFSVIVSILIASTGIYYAFFACFFISIIIIILLLKNRSIKNIVTPIILIGIILTTLVINISPSIAFKIKNGPNHQMAHRNANESEIYGLKITQLLLPVDNHRIKPLANLKNRYNRHTPLINENNIAALGAFGSIGFIFLIICLLCYYSNNKILQTSYIKELSIINVFAVLFATIGGFSSLFALIVTPNIRAHNRISVFISFFSIAALLLLIEKFRLKYIQNRKLLISFYILLAVIFTLGLYDQTTPNFVFDYHGIKREFKSDQKFIQDIENLIPNNSKIYQLPYVPFPENPPIHKMTDYQHFKGYLHSKNLYWSYGSIKGRHSDKLVKNIASQSIEKQIQHISALGFNGIYINRSAYKDRAQKLIKNISTIINEKPLYSKNKLLVFFNLTTYNKNNSPKISLIIYNWENGFSGLEKNSNSQWRWCSNKGKLTIYNYYKTNKKIIIEMGIASGYKEKSDLIIKNDNFKDIVKISSQVYHYKKNINLQPGKNVIYFTSKAKKVHAPADPRSLYFYISNFKSNELQ